MTNSSVKQHYETHLQDFYAWMIGDFQAKLQSQISFFENHDILPKRNKVALDLGAGHGIQSVALAKLGFEVTAIDFNSKLLDELKQNAGEILIHRIEDDIKNIKKYAYLSPELIGCWGDTLSHLESDRALETFIFDMAGCLDKGGRFLASFRDYSKGKTGNQVFIPVKNDDQRILTCVLNYEPQKVKVSDLLWEKDANGWEQKVSSYYKIRVSPIQVERLVRNNGFEVQLNTLENGMCHIIAQKIR